MKKNDVEKAFQNDKVAINLTRFGLHARSMSLAESRGSVFTKSTFDVLSLIKDDEQHDVKHDLSLSELSASFSKRGI